jgi:hypothetical protein
MVQVAGVGGVKLAGIVPPLIVMVVAVELAIEPPPQEVVGVPETVNPAGRVSVRFTPV